VLLTVLRFNFASPQGNPRKQGELLRAALEMAQFGESRGLTSISVDEHHATGHGWSCNPILTAAVFLARTTQLIASVDCALGPLWNPVRLAEDIALPGDIRAGDLLAVPCTGAYHYALSSNYNMVCRPPLVGVRAGEARLLVRRETEEDVLARDLG